MTLHISKGLEFDTVFIAGMEEGLFPLSQNTDDHNTLEEERRLAYVGMTRAKKHLHLLYTIKRNKFGKTQYNQASQFLSEIPQKFTHLNSYTGKTGFSKKQKNYTCSSSDYYESTTDAAQENSSYYCEEIYKVGHIVRHPRFGEGKIQKIEGSGDDLRISVVFRNQKVKKFIAKYAHLST